MDFEQMSEQALWELANPLMDNLMQASTEINHAKHVQDFTPRLRDIVKPDYFERVVKQYQSQKGVFADRVPVALFKRPDSTAFVWKQGFSRVEGDYVAEMVLVYREGKIMVDHVMVF
ncbi:hypothetical protein [Vibrio sp. T11.5]|uniref:hypothetical protein n=1 Tax=Vibrio sp. T11.5 TaxID=2998836 RepID=UPI0022CD4CF0|nr:hypothetical protein [Vibrio sp. T11.5]MDA0119203.1 hypothetical protein [Vibrio sp. T11.5]